MKDHYKSHSLAQRTALILMMMACHIMGLTAANDIPALIPQPQKVEWENEKFVFAGRVNIQYTLQESDPAVVLLRQLLIEAKVGYSENSNDSFQHISLKLAGNLPGIGNNREEAYTISVDAKNIHITAISNIGLYRGVQTLRQMLMYPENENYIPGCSITDWPAFQIRGFMQDIGRNFQSLPMLKEQIDVMAAYKFNTFHFHVTDNPGWRLESKKYPQLSSASSMSRWPGKYYSQEDFLELVNYCNERFITLIPEFDIPGHCEAFRKAMAIDSMSDVRVKPILLDLIDELCKLVPKEKMPFIHLGTDEVWHSYERPATGLLDAAVARVKENGREVIVWRPGQQIDLDKTSITQLWSSAGKPKDGHRYIDSRLNYLNHLDPLAGVAQLYFDRICGVAQGDSLRLGGIICCWNDNNVTEEYDIIRQNPVYPGMLTYSETSWKGQPVDLGENYLAKLPPPENQLYKDFQEFEERLTVHRDRYFQDKPFPYVKQTKIEWKIIGPFGNGGDLNRSFPVEKGIKKKYTVEGKKIRWTGPYTGGTIHIRHFFGFPSYFSEKHGTVYATSNIWSPKNQEVDCWIGFHDWSRSGGRRGGPFPEQSQWHNTNPKVWLNRKLIEPPVWKNPGLVEKTEEIPFEDENYFFRKPAKISLKKGWNEVLLKVPQGGNSWKWMFTFVPVKLENGQVKEVEGLKFSVDK